MGPRTCPGGPSYSKVLQACINRNCWNSGGPNTLCTKDSGLPKALSSKESACQCRRFRFDPWVGKIPWRRAWQPIPVLWPGESPGQRSPAGYSPWSCKESDTTEQLRHQCQYNSTLERGQPDGKDEDISPSALRSTTCRDSEKQRSSLTEGRTFSASWGPAKCLPLAPLPNRLLKSLLMHDFKAQQFPETSSPLPEG